MGDGTGIQWTDATWNPLRARHRTNGSEGWACVRVSEGCKNCYASTLNESQRWGRGTGLDYTVPALAQVEHYLDEETLTQPLRWKKPRRVFVCSMTDLFGEWVTDEQLDRIFAVMALTPQHTYQVLTKRPERMREYMKGLFTGTVKRAAIDVLLPGKLDTGINNIANLLPKKHQETLRHLTNETMFSNVWLGVSVEDQQRADERIPVLLDTPAAVRFLSCEPLLGPVDLARVDGSALGAEFRGLTLDALRGGNETSTPWHIDWVIVGGESGTGARPLDVAWARSLVQQCRDAGVAVFVKQLGGRPYTNPTHRFGQDWLKLRHNHGGNPEEWPEDLRVRQFPATPAVPA